MIPEHKRQGNELRAVFFDMDGVLADTEPIHTEAYTRTFAKFGIKIDAESFAAAVTLGGRRVAEWFVELGGSATKAELYATKDRAYDEIAAERGLGPRPGLLSLVTGLRDAGVALWVVTSARRVVAERLLQRLEISEAFAGIVGSDNVAKVKPAPDGYLAAIELAGVKAAEGVAIEDSPRGVAAGHAAGLAVVAAPTESLQDLEFPGADLLVPSLEELSVGRLRDLARSR